MQQFEVTNAANQVIIQAANLAASTSLKHDKIEPVHLLVALTMGPDPKDPRMVRVFDGSRSRGVLKAAGLTTETARPILESFDIPTFTGDHMAHAEIYSPETKDVIDYAIKDAQTDDGKVASTGHLGIALVKSGNELVAEMLHQLGIHPGNLVKRLKEAMDNNEN